MVAKSVMAHSFSTVPRVDLPRSSFDRSHGLKTAFDADLLVPILVDDVGPGDTFNVNVSFVARLATPLFPILDNLYMETFFFFVPYRLVWVNWEKFCGAQHDPGDTIAFTIPQIVTTASGTQNGLGRLFDYMGIPTLTTGHSVSVLPFRAYNLIWNEWFRDQNLQNSLVVDTDNGPDTGFANAPQKRGKRHDYFTSCLPAPQKGAAVDLPLGTSAEIFTQAAAGTVLRVADFDVAGDSMRFTSGTDPIQFVAGTTEEPNLFADLSNATAATINDLRLAFQTQRLLERDARSGTRYVETILAHFGVTVPDFRVQRPEFLGGGSSPVSVNQVAQTSGQPTPVANDKLGELGAYGVVSGSHGFTKSFTEHGVIIGLANIRGDITYSQGIERYWSKTTRFDFYYPVLAQIGEQGVANKELWAGAAYSAGTDDAVFGYQERYAELRYKPSRLTGLMRPDAVGTLAAWHLSEDFASLPTLGATFIESNTGTPLDRAIAIPTEPHFVADFYFSMKCARPMPLYGVPGNLDHF